jgi:adenylyltransferase/sulfurtransferase
MQEISVAGLKRWIGFGEGFAMIDVREEWEHAAFNIGGELIPVGELMQRRHEIPNDLPVVIYCEKGIRSQIAIQRLEAFGYERLYNLKGGMAAWKREL